MNTKTILAGALLASLLFTSCKKELEPQASSETPSTEVAAPEGTTMEQQFEVQTGNTQTVPTPTPAQNQATPVQVAAGMNPAHGQPNHRCDIAVGAPLNSPKGAMPAPAAMQQAAPQGQASVTPVDMSSGTVATKPGMNPPHGQAGHLCEIAVGAPLPK